MPRTLRDDLTQLVTLAGNATDAFTTSLFLRDETDPEALRLYVFQSLSDRVETDARIPLGHGLAGWVGKNEQPVHARHLERDAVTALRYYRVDEQVRSFAAVPVRQGEAVVGVLAIDSKSPHGFTDKILKLLADFGDSVGRIIARGRERIRLDRHAGSFETVSAVVERLAECRTVPQVVDALGRMLANAVPHETMAVAVKGGKGGRFLLVHPLDGPPEPLPLGGCRLGMVIQHATTIYVPEVGTAPLWPGGEGGRRSFLGVPMVLGGEVIGALGIVSGAPMAYAKGDERALSLVAAAAAAAFGGHRGEQVKAEPAVRKAPSAESQRHSPLADPLTGLPNHRYLIAHHRDQVDAALLAVVNLIGFGQINRQLGIPAGDAVLTDTATRLDRYTGNRGTVARYYGDRFVCLFPGATPEGAAALLDGLAAVIEDAPFVHEGVEIHVTPGVGAAFAPVHGSTLDDLIGHADEASDVASAHVGVRYLIHGQHPDEPYLKSVEGHR